MSCCRDGISRSKSWSDFRPNNHSGIIICWLFFLVSCCLWTCGSAAAVASLCVLYLNILFFFLSLQTIQKLTSYLHNSYESNLQNVGGGNVFTFAFLFAFFFFASFFLRTYLLCFCILSSVHTCVPRVVCHRCLRSRIDIGMPHGQYVRTCVCLLCFFLHFQHNYLIFVFCFIREFFFLGHRPSR